MKFNNLLLFTLLSFAAIMGCKKEVEGCTDKTADNYDPEATISKDCQFKGCTDKDAENYDPKANVSADCIFARDKFVGKYDGTLGCPGTTLGFLTGTTTFSIDEDLSGGKNSVSILITTTSGIVVPVKGTCKDKTLTIDTELKDLAVTLNGISLKADIKAKGVVLFDEAKKELAGPMELEVFNPLIGALKDNCSLTGKKK